MSDLSVLDQLATFKIGGGQSQPETHGYFRPSLGKTLAERFDWLWNHDLQSDLQQAREQLGWKELA